MTRTAAALALPLALAAPCSRGDDLRTLTVKTTSMEPTLTRGDRIGCTREAPPDIARGAVVIFDSAGTNWPNEPESKIFLYRVVGLPGETVSAGDDDVVKIGGQRLDEPYIKPDDLGGFEPVTVPADAFFLMGDNRGGASDSRFNGTVPRASVLGVCTEIVSPRERRGPIR